MNWEQLMKAKRAAIAAKLAERKTHADAITAVQEACTADEGRAPTADEATVVRSARAGRDAVDAELDALRNELNELEAERAADDAAAALSRQISDGAGAPAYDGVARVGAEERTYTEKKSYAAERSFFQDLYASEVRGDFGARDRLIRHSNEVLVEREMSERALATGGLAGLVPPQYLVDKYALLARAGRPTANIVPSEPIPSVGMSFLIPRGTTGASAGVQASENSALSTTDEVWSNVTVNVASVGGYAPVSRQSLERGTPGVDTIIFKDLVGAYGVAVDQQVLSGTGSSGQTLGILATSSINQATAFGAAATAATFYSKVAGQINAVETSRYRAPNVIIMHPRRWNWLLLQVDTAGRPLVVPNQNGPFNAFGVAKEPLDTPLATPVGMFLGLPVITDASIPTSVGTGPEDQVIVAYLDDMILYEDSSSPTTVAFEQTAATTLTVTLVAYGYVAFTAGRYPSAVGVVGGNAGGAGFGLVAPTF